LPFGFAFGLPIEATDLDRRHQGPFGQMRFWLHVDSRPPSVIPSPNLFASGFDRHRRQPLSTAWRSTDTGGGRPLGIEEIGLEQQRFDTQASDDEKT
jgi:hypothetical protein